MRGTRSQFMLFGALVLGDVLLAAEVNATNYADASAKSPYFEVEQYVNMDGPGALGYLTLYLRDWLRLHRAIRDQPRLAHRLRHHPLILRAKSPNSAFDWSKQLRYTGIADAAIQHQPTLVYTLHILSYRRATTLRWFLRSRWFRFRLHRRQVYRTRLKTLRLFVDSGDVTTKEDPLYLEPIVVRGQHLRRLCYGIYVTARDANHDRLVLQRYLPSAIVVLRHPLNEPLVRHVWLEPVGGRYFDRLERSSTPQPEP